MGDGNDGCRKLPKSTEMNKTLRVKLQNGKESRYFTNDQLRELFAKDLKVSQEKVSPMPEGEVSFIFTLIEGKKKGIQVFVDSGCNCAIFRVGGGDNYQNLKTIFGSPLY